MCASGSKLAKCVLHVLAILHQEEILELAVPESEGCEEFIVQLIEPGLKQEPRAIDLSSKPLRVAVRLL